MIGKKKMPKKFSDKKDLIIAEAARRADLRIRAVLEGKPMPEFEPMSELEELAYFA